MFSMLELIVIRLELSLWIVLCGSLPFLYWRAILQLLPAVATLNRFYLVACALVATAYGALGVYGTIVGMRSM